MSFTEAVKVGLSKFYFPYGRASRSEYWWYFLFIFIISGVLGVIGGFVSGHGGMEQTWVGVVFDVLSLLLVISVWMAGIRRLHDIDKSGWNTCWTFLPVVGGIYLLILFCRAGTPGPNKYGEAPAA